MLSSITTTSEISEQLQALLDRHSLVVLDGLQHTRQHRRTHNLELDSSRVGQHNSGVAVVLAVQVLEVLLVRAQAVGEELDVTSAANLIAKKVAQLVQRLRHTDGLRVRDRERDVVEAVGDTHVLNHVHGVQNVRARDRHLRDNGLSVARGLGVQLHLVAELADPVDVQVNGLALAEQHRVDVLDLHLHRALAEVGRQLVLVHRLVLVDDLHRLDREGLGAVLGEHGDHGVQHDLGLGDVRGRALDEDVLRVQRDLRVLAVDDGRQRQHHAVLVRDHGVHGRVVDDVRVRLDVLHVRVGAVEVQQLLGLKLLVLAQRLELDLIWRQRLKIPTSQKPISILVSSTPPAIAARRVHCR